jgi:glycosyltransferase involved in cell wall biosynthesis
MQVLAGTLQERSALRTATVTVRFSSSAERALRAYYRLRDETSFEIIRSSIPAASAHVDVRRRPFSERAVKLLIVGRLVSSKNIDTALRILASMPVNSWELGIVGDGEERSRLEDLCRTLGIASRVVFHGHRDRVDEHYASADLLLLPSRLENYPLVLIEAMSQGLPAIAFRPTAEHLNCNDEIIRPGINGFLCSSDGEFEECVRGILTAPDRLHPLFESTFAEFVAHFSWKTFLDRWDELLDRLALPSRTTS